MAERRTIAAAFENTPQVAEFIKRGVPANQRETTTATGVGDSSADVGGEQLRASRPQASLSDDQAARKPGKNRKGPPTLADKQRRRVSEQNAVPAHPKARIQKSIRFLPHLILQLDEYLRTLPPDDELSLQTVMNDALEMWLQANSRP